MPADNVWSTIWFTFNVFITIWLFTSTCTVTFMHATKQTVSCFCEIRNHNQLDFWSGTCWFGKETKWVELCPPEHFSFMFRWLWWKDSSQDICFANLTVRPGPSLDLTQTWKGDWTCTSDLNQAWTWHRLEKATTLAHHAWNRLGLYMDLRKCLDLCIRFGTSLDLRVTGLAHHLKQLHFIH